MSYRHKKPNHHREYRNRDRTRNRDYDDNKRSSRTQGRDFYQNREKDIDAFNEDTFGDNALDEWDGADANFDDLGLAQFKPPAFFEEEMDENKNNRKGGIGRGPAKNRGDRDRDHDSDRRTDRKDKDFGRERKSNRNNREKDRGATRDSGRSNRDKDLGTNYSDRSSRKDKRDRDRRDQGFQEYHQSFERGDIKNNDSQRDRTRSEIERQLDLELEQEVRNGNDDYSSKNNNRELDDDEMIPPELLNGQHNFGQYRGTSRFSPINEKNYVRSPQITNLLANSTVPDSDSNIEWDSDNGIPNTNNNSNHHFHHIPNAGVGRNISGVGAGDQNNFIRTNKISGDFLGGNLTDGRSTGWGSGNSRPGSVSNNNWELESDNNVAKEPMQVRHKQNMPPFQDPSIVTAVSATNLPPRNLPTIVPDPSAGKAAAPPPGFPGPPGFGTESMSNPPMVALNQNQYVNRNSVPIPSSVRPNGNIDQHLRTNNIGYRQPNEHSQGSVRSNEQFVDPSIIFRYNLFLKPLSITRSHNTNSPVLSNHQAQTPNSVQIHPIINSGYIPPTNIPENLENNLVKPKGESQDPTKPPLAMLSQQIFHHQIQRQLSDKDGKQQPLVGMPVEFSANNYKMDFPTVSEMMNSGNQGNNLPFQHQNIQSNLNNNFNARGQNLRSQDRRFQGYKRPGENHHQSLPNASQSPSVMNHNNNNDNITNNSLGQSNTMSNSTQKSIHHQNSFQNEIEKRNRNIAVNNNNNRDNQQNRDRFANLMSHREKRFVVEIQMKQLRSSEPHMHDYYYQKYVERWLDKNTGQMATETPLQEAKIQHPPDKRKLEKENAEKEEKENSNGHANGETSNDSDSKINKRNSKNGSPLEEHSNKNHSDERSLSKEEELKQYKAPSQPTVADNIESAIAMLGVGLVNKANRPVANQLSRKHSLQSDDQAEFSKNVSDDEMGISIKKGSHEEAKPETEDQSQEIENIQGDQNSNEIDNTNPDENDKNNSSNTTKKGLRKNRKKTHKHESALGRMVKTTHHNPRKMIEVVETGDIQISLQQRNLNLRHLEDALLCVVNIINQDMEELERSERFLEEYREPGSEDEEIMTSSANKIEEINQASPEDSVENNNLTPEEQETKILEAKEVRKEKYRLKKLRNQHSRLVENFEDDLIKLKYVLGFCMEDGEDPENKEDTLVGQWSTILQWRKGRTLVQRSILALAKLQRGARKKWEIMQKKHEEKEKEDENENEEEQNPNDKPSGPIQNYHICDQKYNETENAVTALTFICRCLRVLIHAENSEKTQLNINHQTNYRSTLLQNFSEVKKAIELLPVFASYEALIELVGLVEDNRKKDILKLKKVSDIGLDIVEILPDKFTFSLFCLFIRRIETAIDNYEEEAARFSLKHFHDEERVNLFDDEANQDYGEFKYLFKKLMSKNQLSKFRDALVVYIEKAVENMGEVHRINIVVARPIVQSKAVFSVLDKFGMDFL